MENDERLNELFLSLFEKISDMNRKVGDLENKIDILKRKYEGLEKKTDNLRTDIHYASLGLPV